MDALNTAPQFISVSFSPSIEWDVPSYVTDLMTMARNLGFDGALELPPGIVQLAAMGFVALTYGMLTMQEKVETRLFMREEGPWETIWISLDSYTSAVATVLFMPVRHALALAGTCCGQYQFCVLQITELKDCADADSRYASGPA